eukprot:276162-Amorphochlora_amoeboformis.AAC.2
MNCRISERRGTFSRLSAVSVVPTSRSFEFWKRVSKPSRALELNWPSLGIIPRPASRGLAPAGSPPALFTFYKNPPHPEQEFGGWRSAWRLSSVCNSVSRLSPVTTGGQTDISSTRARGWACREGLEDARTLRRGFGQREV